METRPDDKVIAFVHAKGTSERLPGKNMADLGGVPLFVHAVRAAQAAERVDRVVVDSDSDEILRIAAEYGADTLKRPRKLATNETTGDDLAYWQACNSGVAEVIVQVIPTSPFITPLSIDAAILRLYGSTLNSVVGTREDRLYLWSPKRPAYRRTFSDKLPNSGSMSVTRWETTGLYVMSTEWVLTARRRIDVGKCREFPLSAIEAIDINTAEDLEFARIVWAGMQARRHAKPTR